MYFFTKYARLALISTLFLCLMPNASIGSTGGFSVFASKKVDYYDFFKQVAEKIKKDYVEEVDDQQLVEAALEGMLFSLDPHSAFFDAKSFQEVQTYTRGEFGGIGIEITMDKGYVKVISPYEGSPALRAGIKAGDIITTIDGEILKNIGIAEISEKLRGEPSTILNLQVYRESTNQSLDLKIVRDIIKIVPVKSRLIDGDIAYINIGVFNQQTTEMAHKQYGDLARQSKAGLAGLIMDLRWNPGGLFDQAISVSELFMEGGVIVSVKGRQPNSEQIIKSNGKDISHGLPMVVIINGGSASASEIVAGAFQDNKRAMVVGAKSFGKGSIQNVIPLPGGTAMKLTTARYYTPSGYSIQTEGITPDIAVEDAEVKPKTTDQNNLSESSLRGHLDKGKSTSDIVARRNASIKGTLDSTAMKDFQLLRAVDLVKGMALYKSRG